MPECFFNECHNEVLPGSWKCIFHRHRGKCLAGNCQNQVYARNLCVRHGGRKKCQFEHCEFNARVGDFCSKHGVGSRKKLCTEPGCTNKAHAREKCVRHGGGRKCKMDSCDVYARNGGFCSRHSRLLIDKIHPSQVSSLTSRPAFPSPPSLLPPLAPAAWGGGSLPSLDSYLAQRPKLAFDGSRSHSLPSMIQKDQVVVHSIEVVDLPHPTMEKPPHLSMQFHAL
ncbi:hypothetical protein AC1031_002391 [Aphanomyces cochlioides]|nr:hypothetical protein AC1031_002391 [Aphanomyces cochlioides]